MGGGKPSPGRLHPAQRPAAPLRPLGAALLAIAGKAATGAPTLHRALLDGAANDYPYNGATHMHTIDTMQHYTNTTTDIAASQPFRLHLLSAMAAHADDPDWEYPLLVEHGAPLGVDTPPLRSPGIWPTTEEINNDYEHDETPAPPKQASNYSSADEYQKAIRDTYMEERSYGMTLGPYDPQTAAAHCGCTPPDFRPTAGGCPHDGGLCARTDIRATAYSQPGHTHVHDHRRHRRRRHGNNGHARGLVQHNAQPREAYSSLVQLQSNSYTTLVGLQRKRPTTAHSSTRELYASLLLYRHIARQHQSNSYIHLPLRTDNQGNSYTVSNYKAKK